MNAVLDDDRIWIVDPGNGSSSTSKTSAEGALPVNDSVGSIMPLEYVVIDQ